MERPHFSGQSSRGSISSIVRSVLRCFQVVPALTLSHIRVSVFALKAKASLSIVSHHCSVLEFLSLRVPKHNEMTILCFKFWADCNATGVTRQAPNTYLPYLYQVSLQVVNSYLCFLNLLKCVHNIKPIIIQGKISKYII